MFRQGCLPPYPSMRQAPTRSRSAFRQLRLLKCPCRLRSATNRRARIFPAAAAPASCVVKRESAPFKTRRALLREKQSDEIGDCKRRNDSSHHDHQYSGCYDFA